MAVVVVDTTQKIIKAAKEDLFDQLKADNPTEFGTKVWEDVDTMAEDSDDTSWIAIIFKKETS